MPGSSLWLLPPTSHPLTSRLTTLITTTLPTTFPQHAASSPRVTPHYFPPHVTLTSEIPPGRYGEDAQGWLEGVVKVWEEGGSKVGVRFEGGNDGVRSQEVFYRRCFLGVGFEGVGGFAGLARARGVLGEEVVVVGNEGEGEGEGNGGLRFGRETEKW
jgi:2',3'-cyclic-nucleotide 3'-phosphodiesterase